MQLLHSKARKETLLTYEEEQKFGPIRRERIHDFGAKIQTDASGKKGPTDGSNDFWLGMPRGANKNFYNNSHVSHNHSLS
jgi:hypothetical protein